MTSWQTKEAGASNALLARLAEMHGRCGREATARALVEQWRHNESRIAATKPSTQDYRRVKKHPRVAAIIVETPNQKVMAAITRVASAYFTSPQAIMRSTKNRKTTMARYVCYYVLQHRFGYSLSRIGRLTQRHPTSVANGLKRLSVRMGDDAALKEKIESLLK